MVDRCRLCTTNDREALVEQLASELWLSHRDSEVDPDWQNAAPYWQRVMRTFAATTLRTLEREHG
jgi:hypothetical protein